MELPEITALAARLGITLGPDEQQTKVNLLSAVHRELKDLQVPNPNEEQKVRQVVLMEARDELRGLFAVGGESGVRVVAK